MKLPEPESGASAAISATAAAPASSQMHRSPFLLCPWSPRLLLGAEFFAEMSWFDWLKGFPTSNLQRVRSILRPLG